MLPLEASRWDSRGPVHTAGICRVSFAVWLAVTATECASSSHDIQSWGFSSQYLSTGLLVCWLLDWEWSNSVSRPCRE